MPNCWQRSAIKSLKFCSTNCRSSSLVCFGAVGFASFFKIADAITKSLHWFLRLVRHRTYNHGKIGFAHTVGPVNKRAVHDLHARSKRWRFVVCEEAVGVAVVRRKAVTD